MSLPASGGPGAAATGPAPRPTGRVRPRRPGGALLVAGTTSDAGKSVLTAGLCRWLLRDGVRVAPFKAQNMSLNSAVTLDGAEIGRAQAMQAQAAGVPAEAAMNPVLLKPGSDRSSQVIVRGRPEGEVSAVDYRSWKPRLLEVAVEALAELRARFDVVICEGAGSPAEINLRATDIANMGLARAADLPVLVVGDIDRGGVFAALYGTVALLDPADQALIAGFVVNKFRGDPALLAPGLDQLRALTGRPVLGVLPHLSGLRVDDEDSLVLDDPGAAGAARPPLGADVLRVAVVRFPRLSNVTDLDALAAEPGVLVRLVSTPAELADADLVVLPGTRATVSDLRWLRQQGLAAAVTARAAAGRPVLGVCGGYQMLGVAVDDTVEARLAGTEPGLGLLPVRTVFGADKIRRQVHGQPAQVPGWHPAPASPAAPPVHGYEIRHGRVEVHGGHPLITGVQVTGAASPLDGTAAGTPGGDGTEGCALGAVWGTSWHGLVENDAWRRRLLAEVAQRTGRAMVVAPDTCFAAVREERLDRLGDLVADHLDTTAVRRLLDGGAPALLPTLLAGPRR